MIVSLKKKAETLMDKALAPSTVRLYKNSNKMFLDFCTAMGRTLTDAVKDETVELWLAQLSERGLSYGTIRSHLSALRHHCTRHGLSACLDSPRIQLILKGIKKNQVKVKEVNSNKIPPFSIDLHLKADVQQI